MLESLFIKVDGINVTWTSLARIADNCPSLRVIFIADTSRAVTTAMLDHLIGNCLELAVIEGCSHVLNKQQSLILQTRLHRQHTNYSDCDYSIYNSLNVN